MSNKKRTRTRTQKRRRNVRGGDGGATGFGEYTYGGPGDQHRGQDGSISMRAGGRNNRQQGGRNNRQQGGKSVLMDVAVPAVLLYANNNIYKNKTSNKSRKFRRSTRRYRK